MLKKSRTKHPWYKRKGYLHFDFSLPVRDAEAFVTDPTNIIKHRFSPLIHYGKLSRKVSRNRKAEADFKAGIGPKPKLKPDPKIRNIFYASHKDGYIYSYYSFLIQKQYEDYLTRNQLANNVIAYRAISRNDKKLSNADFSAIAFNYVKSTEECHILCLDISKFFDRLCTKILKDRWAEILGKNNLPDDHFAVFKGLTKFRFVNEGQLIESFKSRFKVNPRKHGLEKGSGGSGKNRICTYEELRSKHLEYKSMGKRLMKKKETLKMSGIAQGTTISGLLSNIFMIDFDKAIKEYTDKNKGFYLRYSDDLFVVVPTTIPFADLQDFVKNQLQVHCADSVSINEKKTEERIYKKCSQGNPVIIGQNGKPSRVQYLGFMFDGVRTYIRESSMSKDRGKTVQAFKKNRKGKNKFHTTKIFKQRSPRKITPYDNKKAKGFAYYAERAAQAHDNSETIRKQIKKNDRFIIRAGARARAKDKTTKS